ncbi:HK97 gp10 family phage protein [Streptomyces beijiangensis]|uniref:HK97 gp10 family phage protein n=1 Tax=Streptomyces beijiangensis TaxID=163361 RepID=A0A939F8L1_9ACTN|nr:HK97 gp10 family phage protein [Streptomyces beijiangensis]MBO0512445.1 HK97 gp10 family phage protein [Streptomyces beijiangensis]
MPSPLNPHPNAHPDAGAYSNGAQIAAALDRWAALTLPRAVVAVRHYAMLLETRIKAHASGRPGPNAPTGDYRRSWTHSVQTSGDAVVGIVGTNKPQGRRLEYGFVGQDSLGRTYNQRPYPHVGPAVEEIRPLFLNGMSEIAEAGE